MRPIPLIIFAFGLLVNQTDAVFLRTNSAFNASSGTKSSAEPCGCDLDAVSRYCKPAFLVIGVQKSGTSTLYHLMRQHPNITAPVRKELLWFNGDQEHFRCALPGAPSEEEFANEYLKKFPDVSAGSAITGEWSASYFHCSCCPSAFQRLMPRARLIVILRDPIARAISRYDEQEDFGREESYEDFDMYVETELPLLENCLEEADASEERLQKRFECAAHQNILGFSLYADALETWLGYYENLMVTYTDELEQKPEEVLTSIEDYLGLSHHVYDGMDKVYNSAGNYGWDKAFQRLGPSELAISKLRDFYTPAVKALKELADKENLRPIPEGWQVRYKLY